jgi:protein-S-isoprenylcysteine O-methyltransferase Ste14
MTVSQMLVLMPGLACFLAFSWGTLRHFRSIGPMPLGMRLIGAVSLLTVAAFTWSVLASDLPGTWPAASILSFGSLALFIWTVRATRHAGFALAFAGAQPSKILVSGPFRYLRHPFYTSYLMFWLATCVATTSSVCMLGSAILLMCYFIASREEEDNISRSRLAAEYVNYASETGMFLPRCRLRR